MFETLLMPMIILLNYCQVLMFLSLGYYWDENIFNKAVTQMLETDDESLIKFAIWNIM